VNAIYLLEVAGFVLIVIGTFLQGDRWPGHELVGKIEIGIGWAAILVESALNSEELNASRGVCFRLPPIERADCLTRESERLLSIVWVPLGRDIVTGLLWDVVIGLLAIGLGWLLTKLSSGPMPPEQKSQD
jgi:hypothetical protein